MDVWAQSKKIYLACGMLFKGPKGSITEGELWSLICILEVSYVD
jgi:hypothetical protein